MGAGQGSLKTDVLIVGLGPVGAALAALLGQWNINVLAIDREAEVYRQPRAAHFDHEIMRLFQQLGMSDDLAPSLRPLGIYEFRNGAGDVLLRFEQGLEPTVSGWTTSYMFHQPTMETLLRQRLANMSGVTMRTGVSLKSLDRNDASGIAATLVATNGEETSVEARFIVGADGGASTLRQKLGITLFDYGFDEPWLVIDTIAKDEEGLPPFGVQSCDPERPVTIMPMSPGNRRWEFMLLPGEEPAEMLKDETIARLLAKQARPGQVEVVRKAVYRFHGLVAKEWRKNSALLAGDSAHQMPPFLGQGMCSGLRDAANLGWKLAAVIKGNADDRLLDTYQSEREPHVRQIIEIAIGMGKLVCTLDRQEAAKRDADMIAARKAASGPSATPPLPPLQQGCLMASPMAGALFPQPFAMVAGKRQLLDDVLGHEAWLVTTRPVSSSLPGLRVVVPGKDFEDEGKIAGWLAKHHVEAALVRPDRYVFGTGKPEELVTAFESALH